MNINAVDYDGGILIRSPLYARLYLEEPSARWEVFLLRSIVCSRVVRTFWYLVMETFVCRCRGETLHRLLPWLSGIGCVCRITSIAYQSTSSCSLMLATVLIIFCYLPRPSPFSLFWLEIACARLYTLGMLFDARTKRFAPHVYVTSRVGERSRPCEGV